MFLGFLFNRFDYKKFKMEFQFKYYKNLYNLLQKIK